MKDTLNILVTVLMPVYNSEKYLNAAIDSILNQSFPNFEFLIIDDGSTDSSKKIIKSYTDSRIVYIQNNVNKGIVASLNYGLDISRGKYIARMDADDIAHPNRLEFQVKFMLAHPDCKLCGTRAIAINENGEEIRKLRRPYLSHEICVQHLFRNSFIHPSIIMDAEIARQFKYSPDYEYAEDYYLFSQIALHYKTHNLKEYLLNYRVHQTNITSSKQEEMSKGEKKTINYLLSQLFEENNANETISMHHSFLTRDFRNLNFDNVEAHLLRIINTNKQKEIYKYSLLSTAIQDEWFNYLYFSKQKNALRKFITSDLFSFKRFKIRQFIKLII